VAPTRGEGYMKLEVIRDVFPPAALTASVTVLQAG
jgi:hypothetical protein